MRVHSTLRLALAASVASSLPACQPGPELDCNSPVDAGSLSLIGEDAEATMKAFCSDHAGGAEVETLTVRETPLVHLDLPCLCGVTDSIFIEDNPELVDLTGLDKLSRIGGGLVIKFNAKLESLMGLPLDATLGATSDQHSIVIVGNGSLVDLEGLPRASTELIGIISVEQNLRLTTVSGLPPALTSVLAIRIAGNAELSSLADLPQGIATIGATLSISGSPRLRDLAGLPVALERVEGTVRFSGLESLAGIPAGLTWIGGDLEIWSNAGLVDLSGLPDDLSVGGALWISDNDRLVDLTGLPANLRLGAAERTGDSLLIRYNDNLVDLSGLPASLTMIPGDVVIGSNPSLVDLAGLFDHVDTITGGLSIIQNHALVDLSGLPEGLSLGVDDLGASLVIAENDGLERLSGFPASMEALPGTLGIAGNDNLLDLSGLSPLRRVAGDLVLGRRGGYGLGDPCDWHLNPGGNASLQSLAGLSSLETVGGSLAIVCNPALEALDTFSSLQAIAGDLLLLHNGALADIAGLGGPAGSLTSIGGFYQISCSPFLDLDAALGVLDHVESPVPMLLQLVCTG